MGNPLPTLLNSNVDTRTSNDVAYDTVWKKNMRKSNNRMAQEQDISGANFPQDAAINEADQADSAMKMRGIVPTVGSAADAKRKKAKADYIRSVLSDTSQ